MMTPQQRQRVVDIAHSWIGTPYHHHARVKGAGVDCAQFLIGVFSEAGIVPEFDTGHYPLDWMLHREDERFLGWVRQYGDEVKSPEPGDIAVFKFGRCFSHGAVVVAPPSIIHSYRPAGMVTKDTLTRPDLASRSMLFFTVTGGKA